MTLSAPPAPTDADLIRAYATDRSESAFAEIVERHLNFVYAAARRQLGSSALAADVAQSVFLDLACRAASLSPETSLVAWLHVVTRRTAIDLIRRETRRRAREQIASDLITMDSPSVPWSHIAPLLDGALASLPDRDRTAVLLRFFENKSLQEVGSTIGISEDAAQKRLTRALERLRTYLVRNGLALSAGSLLGELTAHAIEIAPTGLNLSISLTVPPQATAILAATHSSHVIATALGQKFLLATVAIAIVGGGIYEAREWLRLAHEFRFLDQRSQDVTAQTAQTRADHENILQQLRATESDIDSLLAARRQAVADAPLEAEMKSWLERLGRLKEMSAIRTDLMSPECELLTEKAWFAVAKDAKLDTEAHIRDAFAALRREGEQKAFQRLMSALSAYLRFSGGMLPSDMNTLAPFIEPAFSPALLERFRVVQTGRFADLHPDRKMGVVEVRSPVDIERDNYYCVAPAGGMWFGFLGHAIGRAQDRYATANGGKRTNDAVELAGYLEWPVEDSVLRNFLRPTAGARP